MADLPDRYNPQDVEERIYKWWDSKGYFKAQEVSTKPPFCIILPPPNVTGSLHMGHALDHSIQDVMIRWKRMSGFNALWLPGTDHAGIATQNIVLQFDFHIYFSIPKPAEQTVLFLAHGEFFFLFSILVQRYFVLLCRHGQFLEAIEH